MDEDFQGVGCEDTIYEIDPSRIKLVDEGKGTYSVGVNNNFTNNQNKYKPGNMVITLIIVIANLISGIMCIIAGSNHFETGGLNYEYIHNNKEMIRILTYMFLHANVVHFFNNMVALLLFGMRLEPEVGPLKMTIIYFGSGILAGIISVNVSHAINPADIRYAAGASGAIFGVMCATVFFRIKGQRNARRRDMFLAIGLIILYACISNGANVDIWGHIGGGIAGGLLVFLLTISKSKMFEEGFMCRLAAIVITIAICVIGIGRAGIGHEAKEMNDHRINEVKEQEIYANYDITFGECFDRNCADVKWAIFSSEDNGEVVEFTGRGFVNNDRYSNLLIQFVYSDLDGDWWMAYAEADGKRLNADDINVLFDKWTRFYFEKLEMTGN